VKRFANQELFQPEEPSIVDQIRRYNKQLEVNHDVVLEQYKHYCGKLKCFGLELPLPKHIDPNVHLLVTEFDRKKERRLTPHLAELNTNFGIKKYANGNLKRPFKIENLWKGN
jgi:hypothetical protein